MNNVVFTFAIVNWNTKEHLFQCLTSIYEVSGAFSIQVLVSDNHSEDGSAEMVRQHFPQVTLLCHEKNLGFAGGHEPLFKLSEGSYHVLVNSDVRLYPGCLETIAARMESDSGIGILGCRILGPDGQVQPSCRRFPALTSQLVEASGLNRLLSPGSLLNRYKMGDFDHQSGREVDQVMGSFFLIRRELWQKIGVLDTAFFMYYEEVDYCLRCYEAGYKVFYEAQATVWHEGGGSSKKVRVQTIRRTMRSMRHYFKKHVGGWSWFPLLLIVSLDTVTHFSYALVSRNHPLQTLKAYVLAWWDVLTLRKANQ